ncbi:hypothetical protein FF1_017610 [Malus domestica]
MQERIEKYWKNCSLALATAVVMDPRFKMKLVEFSFNKISGEEVPMHIKVVDDGIHELFHEYLTLPLPLTPTYADKGNNNIKIEDSQGGAILTDNGLTDFDMLVETEQDEVPDALKDDSRHFVNSETVEALICAKDWMQCGSVDASTALVRMEY